MTTDRGSCRNRHAFIGARRIRRTRNFNFPFYSSFLQCPPLFNTSELILGALHPSRITTTFFLLSSLQSSVYSAMWITRGISLINFGVASSALAFQVFVLYPWHHQLDDEFKALKKEHYRVLQQLNLQKPLLEHK
ncbi:unnamed protein product [Penicillium crustosum]